MGKLTSMWLASCAALVLGGCGSTSPVDETESTAADGEAGCGQSLCGCAETRMLDYAATVLDSQTMMPVMGVELSCTSDAAVLSTSDIDGGVSFAMEMEWTPGCGYAGSCGQLLFHLENGPYMDLMAQVEQTNGEDVLMQYLPD